MSDQMPNNPSPESPEQAGSRSVSRRRVVQAGALLAPVFLTMRVPALHAGGKKKKDGVGGGQAGSNASCIPAHKAERGSYDPTDDTPVCGEEPGGPTGGGGGSSSSSSSSSPSNDFKSAKDYGWGD